MTPRQEHPRPDFERNDWHNLNGTWEFRYDPDDRGEGERWFSANAPAFTERIVVPFPWQSRLSEQHNPEYQGVAWYRRTFRVPELWVAQRIFLHFGAVDYRAQVWVNGQFVGQHEGGYTPFAFDITEVLNGNENVVVLRADDPADLQEIPHGKQRSDPPNPWNDVDFTPSSGVWQTVWLEARPATHLQAAAVTPEVDTRRARLALTILAAETGSATLTATLKPPTGGVLHAEGAIALEAGKTALTTLMVAVPEPVLWDVDTPNLYEVTLELQTQSGTNDTVRTYFGMRKVEVREGQVWLNGRPLYLMSALDQGFWPDGLHTAPSDEALRDDIAYAKHVGLNGLRKHIKIEDPRFAYWADKLGLLLWCDAPCPVRYTDTSKRRLARDLEEMIARDYNHPSIVVWNPYNEGWGLEFRLEKEPDMQAWVAELYDRVKALDPTRLVVDNSGWSHVKTDLADFHRYSREPLEWREMTTTLAETPDDATVLGYPLFAHGYRWRGEPLVMSEYGGGWRGDRSWEFRWQTNELRRHATIVGYTYTELYDVEHEYAGFTLYDRTPKDYGYDLPMLNSPDFVVLDYGGPATLKPGDTLRVTPHLSLYKNPPLRSGRLRWRLVQALPEGERTLCEGAQPVHAEPYTVTRLGDLELSVPDVRGPARLWASLEDDEGKVRAQNYLDFEVFAAPPARLEVVCAGNLKTLTLRLNPGDFRDAYWNAGDAETWRMPSGDREAAWGYGAGFFEYAFPLPTAAEGELTALSVLLELAARPVGVTQSAYGRARPTEVTLSVGGVELATHTLEDLRVSARGALTRMHRLGPGEHGDAVAVRAEGEQLAALKAVRFGGYLTLRLEVKGDAEHQGGLTVFGDRTGRYGLDPAVVLAVRD